MTTIVWDQVGQRFYETGVNHGVMYPMAADGSYPMGYPWNGLISVTDSPSGAEPTPLYADNIKYLNLMSVEEYAATIEAYTYPPEFEECNGSADLSTGVLVGQQTRKPFGFVFRTVLGNDVVGEDYGYKLHIVYNALAAPSEKAFQTINDSPEAITFSWEVSTTPVAVTGHKPSASLVIDSTIANTAALATLEDILFGTVAADPRLPLPDEIAALFRSAAPDPVALSNSVPADGAVGVAVDSNLVMTFNNAIVKESVVVLSAAGDPVAGVKSWDAANKILTFNPNANLAAATAYLIVIGGVVDIYSQALSPVVVNFTTA